MGRKNETLIPVIIVLFIATFALLLYLLPASMPSVAWASINPTIISSGPFLVLMGIILYALVRVGDMYSTLLLFGFLGVDPVLMLQSLNDTGIIIGNLMVGGLTLVQVQAVVLLFFIVIGLIVGVERS